MNTLGSTVQMIKPQEEPYIIMLEDLEFAITRKELWHITNLHNAGMRLEDISLEVKRDPYEVIIALLHQARTNRINLRPLAWRD